MSDCKTYTLVKTWGRDEGTPDLKNIKNTNNVEYTGLTEKQRQIQLLKNIDNKNTLNVLGYCSSEPEPEPEPEPEESEP